MDIDILVVRDGWEGPSKETVHRVLQATARDFCEHFPQEDLPPVIVSPRGGPIAIYQRGPDGEIFIRLNTGKTFWAQYAFQFSHELCHVLCKYDQDATGNDWFEESLCEMASLYTLRRMGETWKTSPPYDHWKDFAPHLTSYAADRLEQTALPDDQTLAAWYAEHAETLDGTSTERDLNRVVAAALLPLFEESPEHWAAIRYLNDGQPSEPQTLSEYLSEWREHCPEKHRPFIEKIGLEFGMRL